MWKLLTVYNHTNNIVVHLKNSIIYIVHWMSTFIYFFICAVCMWWWEQTWRSPRACVRWRVLRTSCVAVRRWSQSSAATRSSELNSTSTGAKSLWWEVCIFHSTIFFFFPVLQSVLIDSPLQFHEVGKKDMFREVLSVLLLKWNNTFDCS